VKICYLCGDRGISLAKHNGASAHFRSLVGALAGLGHEVLVLTPSPVTEDDLPARVVRIPTPEVLEALLADRVDHTPAGKAAERERMRVVQALGHVWNNVLVEQTLQCVLDSFRPDLLCEIYSPFGVAGGITAQRMGVPHLLNVHAPLAWEGAHYRRQALQEAAEVLEWMAYSTASCIVANCRELRDQLISDGVPLDKVTVIPNGVDVDRFSPEGPAYRTGLEGKVVVGFVGSLKAWHDIETLVEVFRELAKDPRLHLLVVGEGPMARMLHRLADELPGRITMTGAVPFRDVPSYIRAMDIAVAPYPLLERFYYSPLKVLEYMGAGRPIVASRIGQLEDLVRHGETGFLVPPGDVRAFVEAIRTLVCDRTLGEQMGAEAAREARRSHTWARRAGEIVALAQAHGMTREPGNRV